MAAASAAASIPQDVKRQNNARVIREAIQKMSPQQRSESIRVACGNVRPWEPGWQDRLRAALAEVRKLPADHPFRIFLQLAVDAIDARDAVKICRGEYKA